MFVSPVRRAPGTIIGLKLPPLSRYPCRTGAGGDAENCPTMSPALLMSCATVPSEPGTSIGVNEKGIAEAEEVRPNTTASADIAVRIEYIDIPPIVVRLGSREALSVAARPGTGRSAPTRAVIEKFMWTRNGVNPYPLLTLIIVFTIYRGKRISRGCINQMMREGEPAPGGAPA